MSCLEHSFTSGQRTDTRNVLVFDLKRTAVERDIFPGWRLTDTLGPPVHQLLVALATEAVVASVQVDAASSAVATRVRLTLVVVWRHGEEDKEEERNIEGFSRH